MNICTLILYTCGSYDFPPPFRRLRLSEPSAEHPLMARVHNTSVQYYGGLFNKFFFFFVFQLPC